VGVKKSKLAIDWEKHFVPIDEPSKLQEEPSWEEPPSVTILNGFLGGSNRQVFISEKVFNDSGMKQPLRALAKTIRSRKYKVTAKWVKYKDEDGIMLEK